MIQIIDQDAAFGWLGEGLSPMNAFAALSAALAPAWDIEREVDPAGEVSIVVFPAAGGPALPTFVLYEKDGQAVVATVRDDVWEGEHGFTGWEPAVAAIVADVARGRTLAGASGKHHLEHCM